MFGRVLAVLMLVLVQARAFAADFAVAPLKAFKALLSTYALTCASTTLAKAARRPLRCFQFSAAGAHARARAAQCGSQCHARSTHLITAAPHCHRRLSPLASHEKGRLYFAPSFQRVRTPFQNS